MIPEFLRDSLVLIAKFYNFLNIFNFPSQFSLFLFVCLFLFFCFYFFGTVLPILLV